MPGRLSADNTLIRTQGAGRRARRQNRSKVLDHNYLLGCRRAGVGQLSVGLADPGPTLGCRVGHDGPMARLDYHPSAYQVDVTRMPDPDGRWVVHYRLPMVKAPPLKGSPNVEMIEASPPAPPTVLPADDDFDRLADDEIGATFRGWLEEAGYQVAEERTKYEPEYFASWRLIAVVRGPEQ